MDMDQTENRIKDAEQHVEPGLVRNLKIFAAIISIMMMTVLYKILLFQIGAVLATVGLFAGVGVGFVAGRMFKISWHAKMKKVVASMDMLGVVIFILYIALEISRKWFFGHWLQGATLNAFALSFLSGLLLGRFLSVVNNIQKVLIEEKKI